MRHLESAFVVLMGIAAAACVGDIESVPFELEAAREQRTMEPVLRDLMTTLPAMRKMNAEPLASTAAPGSIIDLWVTETGWDEYSRLHTDVAGSNVSIPIGTTILRVVRDANGVAQKYTLVRKREADFNPPSNLWFASFTATGEPSLDTGGKPIWGKVDTCTNCHLARAQDGFLFGMTE